MDLALSPAEEAFATEVRGWLEGHVRKPPRFADLEAEVDWGRRWQAELAAARWVGVDWPARFGGRGASPLEVAIFNTEYARAGAPQPVNRVGINLAGPTLLAHGTDEQRQRWLPAILTAEELWCQLFSEPGAGSDLASLRTTAVADGDGWVVNGQKVWTSYAQFARWGLCLARTAPIGPGGSPEEEPTRRPGEGRHRGISFLVVDMKAPGVEVRPLRQLTGEAEFNEVFLTDVFVPGDHLVGPLHGGWAVAATTLAHERGTNFPFKEQVVHEAFLDALYREAADSGRLADEDVSDSLARSYVELQLLRLHNWRTLTRLGRGQQPGPESSWIKLTWTSMTQQLADTALDVVGESSPLWGRWQRQWLWSKAASIAGGTSEIQRTIIGERLLGLPRSGSPQPGVSKIKEAAE